MEAAGGTPRGASRGGGRPAGGPQPSAGHQRRWPRAQGPGGGGNPGQGTDTFGQAVAFAKKWWWAILVAIYIIHKEKGGKK